MAKTGVYEMVVADNIHERKTTNHKELINTQQFVGAYVCVPGCRHQKRPQKKNFELSPSRSNERESSAFLYCSSTERGIEFFFQESFFLAAVQKRTILLITQRENYRQTFKLCGSNTDIPVYKLGASDVLCHC